MNKDRRALLRIIAVGPAVMGAAAEVLKAENVLPTPTNEDLVKAREAVEKQTGLIRSYDPRHIDVRTAALWDRARVPAGGAPVPDAVFGERTFPKYLPLFVDAIGTHPPGSWNFKTYADTNMQRGNSLPPPTGHIIERIMFLFLPGCAESDVAALMSRAYFELCLADRIVARCPLARCSAMGELESVVDIERDTNGHPRSARRALDAAVRAPFCLHLEKPIELLSMAHISMTLYTPEVFVNENRLDFYAFLDGTGIFGVQ